MAGLTHRIVFITVGIVLVLVLHLAMVIWALFRTRPSRRVAEHADEEQGRSSGGGGLSSEELGELPCHEFKQESGGGECAVCLEAFRAVDRRRVLPRCGHGFHAECVDPWLRRSRRCPVCRTEAVERRKEDAGGAAAATVEVGAESGR